MDLDRLRAVFPERHILYFDSLDSTMRVASASEPGTIVLADRQLAGLGRHGHTWHSEAGHGIYCSVARARQRGHFAAPACRPRSFA